MGMHQDNGLRSGLFGIVSLVLASVGIGVMSYGVMQRTREFAVRMALSARPADVRAMVVREGAARVDPVIALSAER
jgi:ABC-type antimicrobial peptide transport system permease subunit